jgi:glycosyltransferase involved in cell wall biosynthesis
MKILIISFYYPPDLSAGSFRSSGFVEALLKKIDRDSYVDVITTLPNRYNSYSIQSKEIEVQKNLYIKRIKLPKHKSGIIDQSIAFLFFARALLVHINYRKYDIVYASSARLMTAALGTYVASSRGIPLYLDIRDLIIDSIKDSMPGIRGSFLKPFFSLIEGWAINRADKVNLVSKGFSSYFYKYYPGQSYSFFTNGIDEMFTTVASNENDNWKRSTNKPITVLYTGNIGEGQGLHWILPDLAKQLEGHVIFKLIGDGGRKPQLEQRLIEVGCSNVELFPPVKRDKLIAEYQKADVLFLHLNDYYKSCKKVLPSKLFEYGAMGKPIWAGVSGYAAEFINAEIENSVVFHPCNVNSALNSFSELKFVTINRSDFIGKFSRTKIMGNMAGDFLNVAINAR